MHWHVISFVKAFEMQFWEKYVVYRYIRKTKAHSLVSRWIVASVPSLATLVLRIGLAYVRNNCFNVILKHINETRK